MPMFFLFNCFVPILGLPAHGCSGIYTKTWQNYRHQKQPDDEKSTAEDDIVPIHYAIPHLRLARKPSGNIIYSYS